MLLTTLPVLSKISFRFLPGFPEHIPFVIFQGGMHPYWNFLLCLLAGSFIFLKRRDFEKNTSQVNLFKNYLVLFISVLSTQTLLQYALMEPSPHFLFHFGGLFLTLSMILIYSIIIPKYQSIEQTLQILAWSCLGAVCLSLIANIVSPHTAYKGGRFIGVFKHIPHMVSCATTGAVIWLSLSWRSSTLWQLIGRIFASGLCAYAVYLTGTRSSLIAVGLAAPLSAMAISAVNRAMSFFKWSLCLICILVVIFFGKDIVNYSISVAVGESSIGLREAQNGVESRMEEIDRGIQHFKDSPWLGFGILDKFSSNKEEIEEVSGYNSFKDPHNIFVSAGTIAGIPFIIAVGAGLLLLVIGILRLFLRPSSWTQRIIAVFLIVHLPILIIYHVHLSLGGFNDRVYWLFFGLLALETLNSATKSTTGKIL